MGNNLRRIRAPKRGNVAQRHLRHVSVLGSPDESQMETANWSSRMMGLQRPASTVSTRDVRTTSKIADGGTLLLLLVLSFGVAICRGPRGCAAAKEHFPDAHRRNGPTPRRWTGFVDSKSTARELLEQGF